MALAGGEVHFHDVAKDSVEQGLDEGCVDILSGKTEAQRVDALVQHVFRLGIGGLGIVGDNVLAYIPQVVVLLIAAHKGELARQRLRRFQLQYVFPAIERLYGKPLVGSPYHAFLEIGTFQVHLDLVKPFLCGRCLKLGQEFFSFV